MEDFHELVERAFSRQALHPSDLPDLDLNMDQVITLIDNGYAANKRTPEEKLLTKTMIQNYSKAGLVRPIKGKKYTPEHVVQMLAIYALKRTLTIGEIKQAFDAFFEERTPEPSLSACYEQSLSRKEALSGPVARLIEESGLDPAASRSDAFAALLTAAALSDAFACLTEEILDHYLPPASRSR